MNPITIATLADLTKVSAASEGCPAKFYGPAERDGLNRLGLSEHPPAHEGYWAACETSVAIDEIEAGRPVRWWPADYLDPQRKAANVEAAVAALR